MWGPSRYSQVPPLVLFCIRHWVEATVIWLEHPPLNPNYMELEQKHRAGKALRQYFLISHWYPETKTSSHHHSQHVSELIPDTHHFVPSKPFNYYDELFAWLLLPTIRNGCLVCCQTVLVVSIQNGNIEHRVLCFFFLNQVTGLLIFCWLLCIFLWWVWNTKSPEQFTLSLSPFHHLYEWCKSHQHWCQSQNDENWFSAENHMHDYINASICIYYNEISCSAHHK